MSGISPQLDIRRVTNKSLEAVHDDEELARRTGYKNEFKREFRSFSTFSYACSIMGLVSSVATTLNTPILMGGPTSAVWCWILGSCMNLTFGAAIGELVSAYPSAGGLYSASGLLVPHKYRAITAWFTGWLNFTGQIAGLAGTAYGLAQMIQAWITVLSRDSYSSTTATTFGIFAAICVAQGVINSFPTAWLAKCTSGYVVVNFTMAIVTAILVLVQTPRDERHDASFVFGHIQNGSGWSSNGFALLMGLQCVQFVMTDYDATAHISEEVARAAIAAPVAIFTAIVSTGIMGAFLIISLMFAAGDVTQGVVEEWIGGLAFAQILYNRGGRLAFLIAWPFICSVAWFVCTTALQANARTFYAFSRDNGFPDKGFFAKVDRRTGSTTNAVWLVVACCLVLGCLSFINYTAVLAMFSLASLGMDLSYVVPIVCRQFFSGHPDVLYEPGPFTLGNGLFGKIVNWTAVLWTLLASIILSMPAVTHVDKDTMNYGPIVLGGVLVLAGLWFALYAHKTYHGPRSVLKSHTLQTLGVGLSNTNDHISLSYNNIATSQHRNSEESDLKMAV